MAGIKVTLEFASDKYSWQEAYYWLTASFNPPLTQAETPAFQLAAARVPCLGNGAALARIRLSATPANRQVFDVAFEAAMVPQWPTLVVNGINVGNLQYSASRAFQAILGRCQDSNGDAKNIFLAAPPAGIIHAVPSSDLGIDWTAVPELGNRLNAFAGALNAYSFGWLSRRSTVFQNATLVTNAAFPGMVGVQVPNQLAFEAGFPQKILVKGFRRLNTRIPGANGVWPVGGVLPPTSPATSPWTYFLFGSANVSLTNYSSQGQAGALFSDFRPIVTVQWIAAVERKRGATLNRPRGRSRTGV